MHIQLRDVFDIFISVREGIKAQTLPGEYEEKVLSFPSDPAVITRGIEAALGIQVEIIADNFYESLDDIPPERQDLLSFYKYLTPNIVKIYINTSHFGSIRRDLAQRTIRFLFLKELFNAVLRHEFVYRLKKDYPDTTYFSMLMSGNLDLMGERFSIYDFGEEEYSPTVSFENAAELLTLLFSVDVAELYNARRAFGVPTKSFWQVKNGVRTGAPMEEWRVQQKFAYFEYEKYADRYDVETRHVILLFKTDLIIKIVDETRQLVTDIEEVFTGLELSEKSPFVDYYTRLKDRLRQLQETAGFILTPTAENFLTRAFEYADLSVNSGDEDGGINDAEINIERVLKEAKQRAGQKPIDIRNLRDVISSLCPIFPFC